MMVELLLVLSWYHNERPERGRGTQVTLVPTRQPLEHTRGSTTTSDLSEEVVQY